MNLLVLGGNGYLGSKVLSLLNGEGGHHLVCTARPTSDLSRIRDLLDSGSLRCIAATPEAVSAVMQYVNFDAVLNLACSYGRKGMLYPNVLEANLDFPLRVLNCAAEQGVRKYITVGTALPGEMNMYSFSKQMFGSFGQYYAEHYGISFTHLRLEMFYGADSPRNRFLPDMVRKMLLGEQVDVTIGTQHRDIIALEDILLIVRAVLRSELPGYQELMVGTGVAPTISELVDFVWEETGRRSKVCKGAVPMRENEPDCVGDPSGLAEFMGASWQPVYWKDGIRRMITEMKEQLGNEDTH